MEPARSALPLLGLVLGACLLVFWKALGGDFVYDDLHLGLASPALAGSGALLESLTRPYWSFVEGDAAAGVGFWRPLSTVFLYLGNALGGGAPAGFHAVSLGLHLAATAVAFRLALGLTGSPLGAAAAAAVFGLHPVQVESVAWISAVNDPLSGLLVLAGLDAFHRWREAGSNGWPRATAGLLGLGLLAKESAVALVPLVVAVDLARWKPVPLVRAYLPLAAVAIGWWALRVPVFGSYYGGFDQVTSHLFVPLSRQLTLRVELLGGALGLLAWPAELNLFREVRPEVPASDPALVRAWIALALFAIAAIWATRTGRRGLLLILLIVPAALAPALISFDSVGRFPLSERFLYVAVLAPALALALLASGPGARLPRLALPAGLLLVAALLGLRSHARIDFWRDELTLFRSAVAASPKSAYVRWGLGRVLLDEFQRSGDLATLHEARDAFEDAQDLSSPPPTEAGPVSLDPSQLATPYDQLQSSLGVAWYLLLCALHDPSECTYDEAELVFAEIAKRTAGTPYRRSYARAQTGLGVARSYLGKLDEAALALGEATAVAPELGEAWFARAELERQLGDWAAAESSYRRALEQGPKDAQALVGLGEALLAQERTDEARQLFERAAELDPRAWRAHLQLGLLAGVEGRLDEALGRFDRALEIEPDAGPAHLGRAKALLRLDRRADAVSAFREACRTQPRSFEAHYDLGVLLLEDGLVSESSGHLRAALSLEPDHELADLIRAALRETGAQD